MHAFGLEETNLYGKAAAAGNEALQINKHDTWATHAVAHVYEMTGRPEDGAKFLSRTESDWEVQNFLENFRSFKKKFYCFFCF